MLVISYFVMPLPWINLVLSHFQSFLNPFNTWKILCLIFGITGPHIFLLDHYAEQQPGCGQIILIIINHYDDNHHQHYVDQQPWCGRIIWIIMDHYDDNRHQHYLDQQPWCGRGSLCKYRPECLRGSRWGRRTPQISCRCKNNDNRD